MIIIVIAAYILLIMYEFIPLYRQKLYKEFIVNAVLCLLSFTAAALISLDIKIPSPAKPIENAIFWIIGRQIE